MTPSQWVLETTSAASVKKIMLFYTEYPLLGEKKEQMAVAKERLEAKELAKGGT